MNFFFETLFEVKRIPSRRSLSLQSIILQRYICHVLIILFFILVVLFSLLHSRSEKTTIYVPALKNINYFDFEMHRNVTDWEVCRWRVWRNKFDDLVLCSLKRRCSCIKHKLNFINYRIYQISTNITSINLIFFASSSWINFCIKTFLNILWNIPNITKSSILQMSCKFPISKHNISSKQRQLFTQSEILNALHLRAWNRLSSVDTLIFQLRITLCSIWEWRDGLLRRSASWGNIYL